MTEKRPLRKADMIRINASSLVVLGVGLISLLVVPKLALSAMGVAAYGHFAHLLGFALLPVLLDFGFTPGLTREVGRLHSLGLSRRGAALVHRFQVIVAGLGCCLLGLGLGIGVLVGHFESRALAAVLIGAAANVLVLLTDLGLICRRVGGHIIASNMTRGAYYAAYLIFIAVAYSQGKLSVLVLFAGQGAGALVYATLGWLQYRMRDVRCSSDAAPIPWKRLWASALPEQVNRLQGAFLPATERSLLLAAGGSVQLGAYDVAVRLSSIVTTLPAVVAEPVIALMSSRSHAEMAEERRGIWAYTSRLTVILTAAGLLSGLYVALKWAIPYYGLQETLCSTFVVLVMIGSGVNVLTASRVATFYAAGRPRPVLAKTLGDLLVAGISLFVIAITSSPTAYVACRYLGYIITAGVFMGYARAVGFDPGRDAEHDESKRQDRA